MLSILVLRWILPCCFLVSTALAQPATQVLNDAFPAPASVKFTANKAQWEDHVLFSAELPGGRLWLEKNTLTYDFCDMEAFHERFFHGKNPKGSRPDVLDCHAFKVKFIGANPEPTVMGGEKLKEYRNYYLGKDESKWASKVPVFNVVWYKDLYPGIDLKVYSKGPFLKYDLIVNPGADPDQVKLEYEGLDELFVKDEDLILKTSVNEIIEEAPYTFQYVDGQGPEAGTGLSNREIREVSSAYRLDGRQLSFEVSGSWQQDAHLIIDPTLIFSTFTGSSANNFGYTATYDMQGNLYAGGVAFGTGYPVTIGVYQVNFAGGGGGGAFSPIDISLTKFEANGSNVIWSSYLGGSGNDQPNSLVVNHQDDVIIYGNSYSTDFPTRTFSYDRANNGGSDIILARLNSTGTTLEASTYLGGSADDGVNVTTAFSSNSLKANYGDDSRGEVVVDDQGFIYIAAHTQSQNFPTTQGAIQTMIGGNQDAIVVKLDNRLSRLEFSTLLGGNGNDAAYSLVLDQNQNVYATGGTESSNFPVTNGTLRTTYAGTIDGFVAHISANGRTLLHSTYLGTSSYDQCFFIEIDDDEDIYVLGQTAGSWPVSQGVYSNANSGQFIQKIDPTLSSTIWSTIFGNGSGGPNISPTAFLVDVCEYIYVSGWGGNTNAGFIGGDTRNMPLTNDAYQSTTDGSDLYVIVLQQDASALEYATYMGGSLSAEHVDGGTSRFNKRAEIYQAVCAGCWGNSDFPTANAYSASNGYSSGCNLAAFKMSFPLPGILADFIPNPTTAGCEPHVVTFTNTSIGGNQFVWNFGDGSGNVSLPGTTNPSHTFTQAGSYEVTLVVIDSNSCNVVDTARRVIVVLPQPQATVTPDTMVCAGSSVTLTASGGTTYRWSPSTDLNTTIRSSVVCTPQGTVTYQVVVSDVGGCLDTAYVTVGVLPSPTAVAQGDGFICQGDSTQLSCSGGATYSWSPAAGLSSATAANPMASPSTTTQYIVTATAANGCTDEDTVTVEVTPYFASAGPDQDYCIGDSGQIFSNNQPGTYNWSPAQGLSDPTAANPMVFANSTTSYVLEYTDTFGCTSLDTVLFQVNPLPEAQAGPDLTLCQNDSVGLNASGGQQYSWFPPNGLSSTTIPNPIAFPMDTTTYIVTVIDSNGCADRDSMTITVLPGPSADAGPDLVICQDSSVQLSARDGISYSWFPPGSLDDPNSRTPIATPGVTTDYIVTVMAGNGCTDRDTVRVEVIPTPVAEATGGKVICDGETAKLFAEGGENYVWSNGDTSSLIFVNPDTSTWYTLVAYVEGCPSLPDSVQVIVEDVLPDAAFDATPDSGWVPLQVFFINQSTGARSYRWDFGNGRTSVETDPIYTYQDTGRFDVEMVAYNEFGCRDTAYHVIIVTADFKLFIPNAFTPNGDDINDFFNTPSIGILDYNIRIFDRWGMKIYESTNPYFQWDGTFQGQDCQEGVYTFVVSAAGHLGEKVTRAGTVTLYR